MPVDDRRIPKSVILGPAREVRRRLQTDPDKWNDYEVEQVRSLCGHEWASMPLANVRAQLSALRKNGSLGTVREGKNHGAAKREQPPDEYLEYLETPEWKSFRVTVLEFWDYRCALCYSDKKLDVHHRTYKRLGEEQLSDCVCLCRECHKSADRARQREKKNADANRSIFGNS